MMLVTMAACMQQDTKAIKTEAPYGTWKSPLTAARVTAGVAPASIIVLDGDDVYWVEGRASEGGRNVIVRRTPDGRISDVTPPGFNVRSRVHEYGGAAYTVHRGTVYFSNFADQRLYRQAPGGAPAAHGRGLLLRRLRASMPRAAACCACARITRKGDAEPVNSDRGRRPRADRRRAGPEPSRHRCWSRARTSTPIRS